MSGSINTDVLEYEGNVNPSSVEKASYEENLFANRVCEIPSNMQMRCDYGSRTDSQPVYLGFAPKGLADGTKGWLLHYFTYDDSDRVTARTIAYGNWTNRATESYS